MSTQPLRVQYGLSTDLFVNRKDNEDSVVLGGVGEGEKRWVQVMTMRAAQLLWFRLTRLLYPEKADIVTGLAATAPLRSATNATITTHMDAVKSADALYTLVGWVERDTWRVDLTELDARRLWAALDLVLFPVGWEGRETKAKKLN